MREGVTVKKSAIIDKCWRYELTRRWEKGPTVAWVMLNPSTADAEEDDPTIRRCIGFSQREGFGALVVVNLFSFRTTDPSELGLVNSACRTGLANDRHIRNAFRRASTIIAAWGGSTHAYPGRVADVMSYVPRKKRPVWCLGTTQNGAPRHPLYVKRDQPFERFRL